MSSHANFDRGANVQGAGEGIRSIFNQTTVLAKILFLVSKDGLNGSSKEQICFNGHCFSICTVNFLNIRTPKTFVVITLKFELCGSTIE